MDRVETIGKRPLAIEFCGILSKSSAAPVFEREGLLLGFFSPSARWRSPATPPLSENGFRKVFGGSGDVSKNLSVGGLNGRSCARDPWIGALSLPVLYRHGRWVVTE